MVVRGRAGKGIFSLFQRYSRRVKMAAGGPRWQPEGHDGSGRVKMAVGELRWQWDGHVQWILTLVKKHW